MLHVCAFKATANVDCYNNGFYKWPLNNIKRSFDSLKASLSDVYFEFIVLALSLLTIDRGYQGN